MAQHFALADYAPKRRLQAGSPLARSTSPGERPNRNQIAASLLLHVLVLFGLFLLPQAAPVEVVVPLVTLRIDESGAAGSAGGKAGGGGGGGHGTEASSAPTQEKTAEAASEPQETLPKPTPPELTPPEPTPPEPTPPEPAPPTPTPPTPDASPLPPVPQALAPKPKPPPRPAVKPRPVKAKPVETPTPPAAPTAASEPPPGPGSGEGPPTQNPQPGTAATGAANAGPGGATGVGTGAAGTGRGSFGDGRGLGDDYLDRLRRHLAKYKHYPPEAVKLKQEGTALVEFVLARDGTVLEAHIQRSSGFPLLDQATLEMIRNASPVPKVPDRFAGDRVSIAIPTGFKIGLFDKLF